MAADWTSRRIRVRGLVQAVGFRPHVWRLARKLGLSGSVANDGEGVIVHASGSRVALDAFERRIVAEAPPLARVETVESVAERARDFTDFVILNSAAGEVATGIVPDAATCPDCLAELTDRADRRHGYAFGNCTHCGPRMSIIRAIPYDRANTSMASFAMCDACRAEYEDPEDRRFHAQPTACPDCGPRLWLEGQGAETKEPVAETARLLRNGKIAAIKGLGGFHLSCDARNAEAVHELRRRKARDAKPFALMARTVAGIARYCHVDAAAADLLASPAAPIVLLPIRADAPALPEALAPGQDHLGFMLPYTPLHHLLLDAFDGVLVMTSGNRSDEPQVTGNDEARERLLGLADTLLMHDRDIVNRVDDSVMALDGEGPVLMRRARGFAPAPVVVSEALAGKGSILAMGGELKATFCMMRDGQAVLSQHIGDLEDMGALDDYRRMLDLFRDIYRFEPDAIAVDLHPEYLSTKLGKAMAQELGVPLVEVPHHHAHMASCMAEQGIEGACHAIVLDGLGMGADGTLWGGEVLRGDAGQSERIAGLPAVALPGGAAAMKQPWRNLVAHLRHAFGADWRDHAAPLTRHLPDEMAVRTVEQMIAQGLNSPACSSAGRVFDAVAAALGIHAAAIGHEAQAAMELEALARPFANESGYVFPLDDLGAMWRAIADDLAAQIEPGVIAARFHAGLAGAFVEALRASGGAGRVILSGGVLQNRVLRQNLSRQLRAAGLEPVNHRLVPANDGGLSLGQAVTAAQVLGRGKTR